MNKQESAAGATEERDLSDAGAASRANNNTPGHQPPARLPVRLSLQHSLRRMSLTLELVAWSSAARRCTSARCSCCTDGASAPRKSGSSSIDSWCCCWTAGKLLPVACCSWRSSCCSCLRSCRRCRCSRASSLARVLLIGCRRCGTSPAAAASSAASAACCQGSGAVVVGGRLLAAVCCVAWRRARLAPAQQQRRRCERECSRAQVEVVDASLGARTTAGAASM